MPMEKENAAKLTVEGVCMLLEIMSFRYMPYEIPWSSFMGSFKDFFADLIYV